MTWDASEWVVHPSATFEGGHLMFDHHCTACHKRQLIFSSQVASLSNTEHGIVVDFTCWCGAEQTMVTGLDTRRPRPVAVAA